MIPTRTLRNSSDPKAEIMDFIPLWPPAEPFCRIRNFPERQAQYRHKPRSGRAHVVSNRSKSLGKHAPLMIHNVCGITRTAGFPPITILLEISAGPHRSLIRTPNRRRNLAPQRETDVVIRIRVFCARDCQDRQQATSMHPHRFRLFRRRLLLPSCPSSRLRARQASAAASPSQPERRPAQAAASSFTEMT